MATVNCSVCGGLVGPADLLCPGCGIPANAARRAPAPTREAPVERAAGESVKEGDLPPPSQGALDAAVSQPSRLSCPDPTCAAPLPADAERCPYCRGPVASPLVLAFPWGQVEAAQELAIGRDPAWSTLADQLSAHGDVSRRHAIVTPQGRGLGVHDAGSTYGTFHNGVRLAPGEVAAAAEGDELRFGVSLRVEVQRVR